MMDARTCFILRVTELCISTPNSYY
uniref:Uncharacterized protein n=1 Tax=Tetranychus urticae TaxID=32264 RepID=T1KZG6_TETUR